jgi:hypothetical protein
MEYTTEELQERRKQSWNELKVLNLSLKGLKETLDELQKQHKEALCAYEKADRALALIDGRAKKVEASASNEQSVWKRRKIAKEPPKVSDLTQEQIDELLKELDPTGSFKPVPMPDELMKI